MNSDWIAAFEALYKVYSEGAYSNLAINEATGQYKDCSAGFVRYISKGVLRNSVYLDNVIAKLSDRGGSGIKRKTRIVLKMGIYAVSQMDSVPDHAAVSECVSLAKKVAKGTEGFVNAILREYIRRGGDVDPCSGITDEMQRLSVLYSASEDLVSLLVDQYGEEEAEAVLKAFNEVPDHVDIRTNTLAVTRNELLELLESEGLSARPVKDSEKGIRINNGDIITSSGFAKGLFTVQSASSQKSIEVLDPVSGANVLDMCAAPGGKSTAMAEMVGREGSVVSCDIHPHRVRLIENNAQRLGIGNITVIECDASATRNDFKGRFNYVLADVPCSGLGVISAKPELKWQFTASALNDLYKLQAAILENAMLYTAPGGYFMYSTCTLNERENEGIVKPFLEKYGFVEVVESRTIMPYNSEVGFYYCKMKKLRADDARVSIEGQL